MSRSFAKHTGWFLGLCQQKQEHARRSLARSWRSAEPVKLFSFPLIFVQLPSPQINTSTWIGSLTLNNLQSYGLASSSLSTMSTLLLTCAYDDKPNDDYWCDRYDLYDQVVVVVLDVG